MELIVFEVSAMRTLRSIHRPSTRAEDGLLARIR
jgi:hypothetical protein